MINPIDINPYDLSQRDLHKKRRYSELINAAKSYSKIINEPPEERSPYDLSNVKNLRRAKSRLEKAVRGLRR